MPLPCRSGPPGGWTNPILLASLPFQGLNTSGVTTSIPADISPDGLTRATVYRWAAGGTASGLLTATACSAGQGETELYLASAYSDGTTADVVLAYNDASSAACGWTGGSSMVVLPGLLYSLVLAPVNQSQAAWTASVSAVLQPYPPPPPPTSPPPPAPPAPPPAPPPPPYSASTCGALLPDTYFQGADLPGGYDVANSPQDCCDRCAVLPECGGFSFTTDLDVGATYCSLKGSGWSVLVLADTAWDGATSAVRPAGNQPPPSPARRPPPARPPPPPAPPPPKWTSGAATAGTLTAAVCSAGLMETTVEVLSAASAAGPFTSQDLAFNDAGPTACVTAAGGTGYKGSVALSVAGSTLYMVVVSPLTDGDATWQARLALTLA
ncbi:hypothetical protein ABPG77_009604 [Micractinium sp. CCAP 211/92]